MEGDDNVDGGDDRVTSKLGTKQYWDECYEKELVNWFEHDDPGENWFGEPLTNRIALWIKKYVQEHLSSGVSSLPSSKFPVILDLGSGNGALLFRILERLEELENLNSYELVGADYSEAACVLANSVAQKLDHGSKIAFRQMDVLDESCNPSGTGTISNDQFDIICDKGTFDAICLNPDSSLQLADIHKKYRALIHRVLKPDGVICIASCNWTRDELIKIFSSTDGCNSRVLEIMHQIDTPKFQFGGKTGNQVTCLIFKLKILNQISP